MIAEERYTTQLASGLGMIPETADLLRVWVPGTIPARLSELVVREGVFARTTARRSRNLVGEMFAPRYLANNGVAAERLKYLQEHRFSHKSLIQLFFLYTARAQRIFADFVTEVYWPKYSAGAASLSLRDAEAFINRGLDSGKMVSRWSAPTIKKNSSYLIGCCSDFGLIKKGSRVDHPIQRVSIRHDVALYLAHDLHFSGLSDMAVIRSRDWLLFGFESGEVITHLKSLAHDGHFVIQSSGELVQISWKYKNMEDCLHALVKR